MVVVLGIDPGTAHTGYGVVLARAGTLAALDGGVIGTQPSRAARAAARRDPRARVRPDRPSTSPTRWRSRTSSSARTPAARSRSARRAASCCWRRARPASRASPTRRRRSSRPSAAAAGAEKDQVQRMVGALLSLPEPPEPRPRGGRARGRHLPRQRRRAEGGARMIASVRGTVIGRRPDHVVIEAAGVGYRLAVSAETLKARAGGGQGGAAAEPPGHARRRHAPLRLRAARRSASCSCC